MLTEAQVTKARTFPGCGDITAENAVDKLFAAAEQLQATASANPAAGAADALRLRLTALEAERDSLKARVPTETPKPVLKAMAGAARTYMDFAVKRGAVSPVVAEMLGQNLIGSDDAPSAVGLTPSSSGECVATFVFKALSDNQPLTLIDQAEKRTAKAQIAPRAAHGAPEDKEPGADRIKQLMEMTPLGQAVLDTTSRH